MRHLRSVLLFCLALATCVLFYAVSAGGEGVPEDDNTTRRAGSEQEVARALLMIVGDPSMTAEDVQTALLVAGWMHAGQGPTPRYRFDPLSKTAGSGAMVILEAWTSGPGEPADATQAVAAGQKKLQEGLLRIHHAKLEPFDHKIARAEERMVRAEKMIARVTQDLQNVSKLALDTGQAFQPQDPQLSTSIKRDNLTLRAELAGLQAQRTALVEQIAKTKDKLDAAQDEDQTLMDDLAQVVKLHQDQLAATRKLVERGFATPTELSKVEVALAQARADLADRRRVLVKEAGGEQLSRFNQRLVDTQISITTIQARLRETEKALLDLERSAYSPVSELVIFYQRTRRALDSAWAEEEAAAADLAKLKRTIEAIPAPKVIVIGVEAKPK